jgi:hypothetical protein
LGCAPNLQNLKDCFQLLPEEKVLSVTQTAYEAPTTTLYKGIVIPCRESQQELGTCVITNAKELQQRLNASK